MLADDGVSDCEWAMKKILRLPTTSDLCVASFDWARAELAQQDAPDGKPDMPMILGCSELACPQAMRDWLWENSRVTSICFIPVEVLGTAYDWYLEGYGAIVVSAFR